jgi:predicted porin
VPGTEPIQPPFSPLFGPYSAPLSETPAAQDQRQTGRPLAGRAISPEDQTERLLLTPSMFIDEVWTDNVFLNNSFKRSDFITQFTPGLQLGFREPGYGVSVGYVFTSEIYAELNELNDAQARWAASAAGFYQITPQLKFNLEGGYIEDNNTTASGIAGISTGRTRSRGGIVVPSLTWNPDPLTTLQFIGSWYSQTFDELQSDVFANSFNTYTLQANASRSLTPTLRGLGSYQYLRSDVSGGDDAEYHLIQLGANYQFTQSLSGQILAGPQIVTLGDTGTSLALQIGLSQRLATWGAASLTYTRAEQPNGGLGGTSETNTVTASLTVTNVGLQALTVSVSPFYTTANSGNGEVDTDSIGISVLATYPITRWMLAALGYTYFRQRNSGTSELNEIDANRVTLGVQLFYPVRLQ